MTFHIRDLETEQLARELARLHGKSEAEIVKTALQELAEKLGAPDESLQDKKPGSLRSGDER
jgi:hypothetical protein